MDKPITFQTAVVEIAYKDLLSYKKEVINFLLFTMSFHHFDENYNWINSAKQTLSHLRSKRTQVFILGTLLFESDESAYCFSDSKVYSKSYLYSEYLQISRDTVNWLNAVNLYLII